ncbi:MAG: type transporter [Rhodocyclaceae bacterium]|nr:type transporter [Rhodocyclaceae bacterium]
MQRVVIEAGGGDRRYWQDLWRFRELMLFLAWRDLLVRYKQTAIGLAWALLRPLVAMVAFTVIFGQIAKLPSDGVPYPLLVFSAMLPWQLFASAFADSGNSVVANAGMVSKIYFPRLILPLSTLAVCLADFAVACLILVGLMAWYGHWPSVSILSLPVFMLMALAAALGAGLVAAALNVRYRDVRYVLPFVLQFGLYFSPVGFSSSLVPDGWRLVFYLNPIAGAIDGFRWSLLGGGGQFYLEGVLLSALLSLLLLVGGLAYFRRVERSFADNI